MKSIQGTAKATVKIESTNREHVVSADLGDPHSSILSININKDLNNPTGSWSVTFAPIKDKEKRTWFDMVEVWDYIEIKLKGVTDEKEKLIMRGIIDNITKSESYDGGIPNISISMSGRDFGALFTDFSIFYMPELDPVSAMLKVLSWKDTPPILVNGKEALDFILDRWRQLIALELGNEGNVSPSGEGGYARLLSNMIETRVECMYPENKSTTLFLMSYEGPYWNALLNYQDKPFHEIFLYDTDDMTYVVMRPSRLKDAIGNYHPRVVEIMGTDFQKSKYPIMYPDNNIIADVEKISMSVSKNSNEIYNYFFTFPQVQLLSKTPYRVSALAETGGNPSNSVNPYFALDIKLPSYVGKYGFRRYDAATVFADMDIGKLELKGKNRDTDYSSVIKSYFSDPGKNMNKVLVAWYLHNPHLLSGTMDVVGTNRSVIGTYVRDDSDGYEYYVEGVSHSFVALESYRTTLTLTRGQPSVAGLVGKGSTKMNKYFLMTEDTGQANLSNQNTPEKYVSGRLEDYYGRKNPV